MSLLRKNIYIYIKKKKRKGVVIDWVTTPFGAANPKGYNLNLTSTSPTWHPPMPMREGDYVTPREFN